MELRIDPTSCALHNANTVTLRFPTYLCGFSPAYNPGGAEDNGIYYDLNLRVENALGQTVYTAEVGDLHSTLTDPIFGSAVTLDGSLAQPGFSNEMPSGKKSTCLLFTIKNPLAPTLFEQRGSFTWKLVYENASGRWEQILSPSAFDGNTLFYFESCLGSPSFFPEKGSKYFVNLELWQENSLKYFAGGTIYGYSMQEDPIYDDTAYKITWIVDEAQTVTSVYKGALPLYPYGTPTKSHPDPTKYYVFKGWSPEIAPASRNTRYKALFEEKRQSFAVELSIGERLYSSTLYSGDFPHHAFTFEEFDGTSYTLFCGFDKPLEKVTESRLYTASLKSGASREEFALLSFSRGLTTKDGYAEVTLWAEDEISAVKGLLCYDPALFSLEEVTFSEGFEGSAEGSILSFSAKEGKKAGAVARLRFKSLKENACNAIDLLPLEAAEAVAVDSGYLQTVSDMPFDANGNGTLEIPDVYGVLSDLSGNPDAKIDCYPDGAFSIKDVSALCSYLSGKKTDLYLESGGVSLRYESGTGGKLVGSVSQSLLPFTEGQAVYARSISHCYAFLGWSDGYGGEKRTDEGLVSKATLTALFSEQIPELKIPQIHISTGGAPINSTTTTVSATLSASGCEERFALQNEKAEIRGRGNSSWDFPRPSYKLKFEEKQHFLGLGAGAEKDWILLTTYSDKSLLRNYATFRLGQLLDGVGYSPDCTFIELYLNGEYRGIYLLCAQVEVSTVRLRLNDSQETNDKDYLILLDHRGQADSTALTYFTIKNGQQPFVIKSQVNSVSERTFIRSEVSKLNTALLSGDEEAIRALCDVNSLVDNYILQEFSHNRDVGFASFYFYRQDGLFYFGPPWDFDLALGNDRDYPNALNELYSQNGRGNHWFESLSGQSWFNILVKRRLAEIEPMIETVIGETAMMGKALEETANRQYDHFKVMGTPVFLEPAEIYGLKEYHQHVEYLTSWMEKRLSFLLRTFKVVR
jgi:hypothetical protein